MANTAKRKCPACRKTKVFRLDQKTCGCGGVHPFAGKHAPAKWDKAEASEVIGDKWTISLPKTPIHTLDQLIEHCKVDLGIWEVERFVCNKWEVGMRPAAVTEYVTGRKGRRYPAWTREVGDPMVIPLFQVKAFLKKKVNIVDAKAEIEALKKLAAINPKPPAVDRKKTELPSGNMLEVNMPDHHFGKLAWGTETGGPHYDVKIAKALFVRAFDNLLERVKSYRFDEALFVVGNDLLNSDDLESRTTKGTIVSTDGRYQKTFATVRDIMIQSVERLREVAPKVKVVMVSGNHDKLSVWHLGDSLECWFNKYDDVEIDNSPKYRKYHRFGNVMLLFTHGDKGRRADYPLLMATEQSKMFGETKFREAHTGHNHVTKVDEKHGVRVRILPALCPPDDWMAENAMVKNQRSSEAYVWNAQEGLITIAVYTDPDDPEPKK